MQAGLRRVLAHAGLLQAARRARAAAESACPPLVPRAARRDRTDNAHLRLLLAFLLAPDDNCIDVGASQGDVLREIVRVAPHGRHIAYEPLPDFHARLVEQFPNVDVRHAAVSDHRGEERFMRVLELPAYSGLRRRTYPKDVTVEEIVVPVEDLDSSLPEGYVPALVKIDVEGAEEQVLAGAIGTITRHKPVVVLDHGTGASDHYGTGPDDVFDLLCRRAGLRLFDIDGDGPYDLDGLRRVFRSGELWTFVAHR